MSVDTKGLVLTDNKDVFGVCQRVNAALLAMFRDGETHLSLFRDDTSILPSFELSPYSRMVEVHFKYRSEQRSLHIHFDCDWDAREYGEHALLLSLGCWGSSELIMRTVLASLQDLGPTYIDVNDCDDEDYVLVESTTADMA